MRDIKFRALCPERNIMFNVDRLNFKGSYKCRFTEYDETTACQVGPGDVGEQECYDESIVIMQYTGRKDKKGVEIYESDITVCNGIVYIVSWHPDAYFFFYSQISDSYGMDEFPSHQIEVIGNIYENPDLLEITHD